MGFPVRLHPETAACSSFEIAKIFVNADLTKDLPDVICFTIQGKPVNVEFSYPWLPSRCTSCGKWGHLEEVCAVNKGTSKKEERKEEKRVIVEEVVGSGKSLKKDEEVLGGSSEEMSEEKLTNVWSSPIKGIRSSGIPKGVEDNPIKITPSRYLALSISDERDEDKGNDSNEAVEDAEVLDVGKSSDLEKGSELEEGEMENTEEEDNVEKKEDMQEELIRQYLPRTTKNNHKFIADTTVQKAKEAIPSKKGRKGNRKNLQ